MNDNKNYLSLGNMFNIIKSISSDKSNAMQTELFCSMFNISDINATTVNNYCIGYRPIGIEYKRIYILLKEKFKKNRKAFFSIVFSLLSILDGKIYSEIDYVLDLINKNRKLQVACNKLLDIASKDQHVSSDFIKMQKEYIKKCDYYDAFVNFLIYVTLENTQPIYVQDIKVNINKEDLEEYLKIKLYEGISYITSLQELSKKNNMYANAELGSLEFDGLVSGKIDYQKSYEYYLRATSKNHPKACWMVADLILTGKVGNIDGYFNVAWLYLTRAVDLGSVAAINTMGNCYYKGLTPNKEISIEKAKECYIEASELGYTYAYNNLGKIYEVEGNFEEALKNYKISADLGESWALNKVGEYYRKNGDKKTAYIYYLKSSESPVSERNYHSFYNLAKYYYLRNKTTKSKGIECLKIASEHKIKKAQILLKKYI